MKRSRDGYWPTAHRAGRDRRCGYETARGSVPMRYVPLPRTRRPVPSTAARGRRTSPSARQPARIGPERRGGVKSPSDGEHAARSPTVDALRALAGPMPGSSCSTRKAAIVLRGLSAQRSTASRSFTCAASRNFRPPYFTYGILRRVSSTSSTSLCASCGTAPPAGATARSPRAAQHLLHDVLGLRLQVVHRHVARLRARAARRNRCLRCWRGASAISALARRAPAASSDSSAPASRSRRAA